MKKIHIIRHAKSSWEDQSLADIERPLNPRGLKIAPFMAQHIYDAGCRFEHLFCSPAVRTQSTIGLIAENLKEIRTINIQWKTEKALYTFDSRDLHEWFKSLDDSMNEVVIVGHNPALTDFCNEISNSNLENIPTCGYVQLVAQKKCCWRKISKTPFQLKAFLRPKRLMKT